MTIVSLLTLMSMTSRAADVSATWTAKDKGYSSGQSVDGTTSAIDSKTSVTFRQNNGANGPKYYSSGESVRLYPSNTMTISGENITKIVITFGSGENSNTITATPASYSNGTWTGKSNDVTFTVGGSSGHRRIASLTVTYTVVDVEVTEPVLPAEFTFWPKTNETPKATVTLEPPVEGLTLCYTTDGSDPQPGASEEITSATDIVISKTTTIKALAYSGNSRSDIVSATYTLGKTVNSITDFKRLTEGTEARLFLSDDMNARVIYNNNGEVYLRDKTGAICFSMDASRYNPQPAHNQHVAGWIIGKYTAYKGLPEFVSTANTTTEYILFADPVSEPATEPEEIDAEEFGAYYADWVRMTNLQVANDGQDVVVGKDDYTFTLYNKFNLSPDLYEVPANGMVVNLTGIAIPNGSKDEIAPIYIEGYPPVEVVGETDGINEIVNSTESDIVIYNIAGQRVERPSKGVYIINGKKMFIK